MRVTKSFIRGSLFITFSLYVTSHIYRQSPVKTPDIKTCKLQICQILIGEPCPLALTINVSQNQKNMFITFTLFKRQIWLGWWVERPFYALRCLERFMQKVVNQIALHYLFSMLITTVSHDKCNSWKERNQSSQKIIKIY